VSGFRCPQCQHRQSRVVDSRGWTAHSFIRRRRKCLKCSHLFTTYESLITPSQLTSAHHGVDRDLVKRAVEMGVELALSVIETSLVVQEVAA
jgi:transcriptional regulator NrdR family protein